VIDSVKFASPAEVTAYVEAALTTATAPEWHWSASDEDTVLASWVICPAGEEPSWNNRWVLMAAPLGDFFIFIHSNHTGGLLSTLHCLENATYINRLALGMTLPDGEPATLALLLRTLFETTKPNVWDPT